MARTRLTLRVAALAGLLITAACSSRAPERTGVTMPSPDGCFVQVWDAPQFRGRQDFVNGPVAYATLRDLPGGRIWRDRIRSVKVGPATLATAYADENFQGVSLPLHRDQQYPALPDWIAGQIESIRIDCTPQPAD